MSARYQTASWTTATVNAGATVQANRNFGPSLFNIVKIKIVPDSGSETFNFRIYKNSSFAGNKLLVRFESQIPNLYHPVDRSNGLPGVEALEGYPIPYDDENDGGDLHYEFVNNGLSNHTFTVTIEYEEVPKMDASGNAFYRGLATAASSTYYGGSAVGSTLTLQGTSNGAPVNAHVFLNPNGGGNVGIFTSSPGYSVHVKPASGSMTLALEANQPFFALINSAAGANAKIFDWTVDSSGNLFGRLVNDAYSSTTNWLQIARSGTTISSVQFGAAISATAFAAGTNPASAGSLRGPNAKAVVTARNNANSANINLLGANTKDVTFVNGTTITVNNNGTYDFTADAAAIGWLLIMETTTDDRGALFEICGGAGTTSKVIEVLGTVYSATSGNAGTTNVFWNASPNLYRLENKRGGTRTYRIIFLGDF